MEGSMAANHWNLIDIYVSWFIITTENKNSFIQMSVQIYPLYSSS